MRFEDCPEDPTKVRIKMNDYFIPKREWIGLTDEEIDDIQYSLDTAIEYDLFDEGEYGTEINIHPEKFARAIEAKLKEKNHDIR
jgi:hypothetical protein